ncbi:hypothetical protein MASR2M16_14780 [Thauera terpenica]|jgi:predicted DNA-binding transcriptional regulator AlpA
MNIQPIAADHLLTIKEIVGDPKATPPVRPLIPVSRSTWLAGIKSGRYPSPVRMSARRVAWRKSDIDRLITDLSA